MSGAGDAGRNIATLLVDARIAATEGGRRALLYRDKTYSFHDLAALVNRAGNMLRALGVGRGDRVLILLSPSPALFGLMLGAMKIGAIALVPGGAPDSAAARSARHAHPPVAAIVDGARFDELSAALGDTRLVVAGDPRDDHPSLLDLLRAAPSSLAAEPVEDETPALVVLGAGDAAPATHADLAREARGGGARSLRLGGLDLSAALSALAACTEISIPAAQP